MNTMIQELKNNFADVFGNTENVRCYFAPGRVNLIGEHTDYNGGHVFPCALTLGTYGIARKRTDRKVLLYSLNFKEAGVAETSLDDLIPSESAGWTNYPKGVVWAFEEHGYVIEHGFEMLIYGDIPNGSGLSSSASLEVLTGLVLKDLYEFSGITMQNLAVMGQFAENNYNGMNCGIMDQFASAMGKKDCAIFLDTNTLKYEYAPVKLHNAKIVITNSKVKHSLVSSAYNDRRRECEEALHDLQEVVEIENLGDLSSVQFDLYQYYVKDPTCRRRARHAILENERTMRAVEALNDNNLELFGQLMNESHISLRDDYEVSCPEIDLLVELAWKVPGVVGSRITGGGFGGCTVSIVKRDSLETFVKQVCEGYEKETGLQAEIYIVECGEGAHRIDKA